MDEERSTQETNNTADADMVGDGSPSEVNAQGERSVVVGRGLRDSTIITGDVHIHGRLSLSAPFQAPAVPRYFVPRPEVSNDLKRLLLTDEAVTPGALVVSAVHGLGGIGKTTLVAALAHDLDLQARFPDGVLWTTLGQEPDVLSLLTGWIQVLGDYDFHPTLVDSASAHLRTLLHDKACLLVVDDAWQASAARAFFVGGEHCRVLITTRDAALAHKVGARLYDLDVMTEAQALDLFEARLGPLDGDRERVAALARDLGYLPLALELAAAQVEGGFTWAELLDVFRQELADLAALDLDEATYRSESLRLSFRLSLEQLSAEDRGSFDWLGMLPEDARLNPVMVATLWDQPEAEARKRLRRLRDKALLKSAGEDIYDIHDLLHDEAKLRLVEQMPLPEAHADLLDRYRRKIRDEAWHHLPDDGYIHEHLTWHMDQAGQVEAIHALLRLETEAGCNAWYEAREAIGQMAGYLVDVRRAWQLTEEGAFPISIGLQCRYGLILVSLNSLAHSLSSKILKRLVEERIWLPTQGLTYVCQIPHLPRRVAMLKEFASWSETLKDEIMKEALKASLQIGGDGEQQAEALESLAPELTEPLLLKALEELQKIENKVRRTVAMSGLASRLPESLLWKTWTAAHKMEAGRLQVVTLARLASHLPEREQEASWWQVLKVIDEVGYSYEQVWALSEIVSSLPESLLESAFIMLQKAGNDPSRTWALDRLAHRFADFGHSQKALEVAQEITDPDHRAMLLSKLISHLTQSEQQVVLRESLAIARGDKDSTFQVPTLTELALHLIRLGNYEEALALQLEIEESEGRAQMVISLLPHLPEPVKSKVLEETLATAQEAGSQEERTNVLLMLGPYLPGSLLRETLAVVEKIEDNQRRAAALMELAPYFSGPSREYVLRKSLEATQVIGDVWQRTWTLAELTSYLPVSRLKQTLTVKEVLDAERRTESVIETAPHLLEALAVEGLVTVQKIEDESERAVALAQIAPRLSNTLLQKAVDMALEFRDAYLQAKVLLELVPYLPQYMKTHTLQDTLAAVRGIQSTDDKAYLLARLASYLPESLVREALLLAQGFQNVDDRAKSLCGLASQLAALGSPEEALLMAQDLPERGGQGSPRLQVLLPLIPHLQEPMKSEVIEYALSAAYHLPEAVLWGSLRAEALAELIPHLPEPLKDEALVEAMAATRKVKQKVSRAESLAKLVPYLPSAERVGVMREAVAATHTPRSPRFLDDVGRAQVLIGLAPYLPEQLLGDAQAAALKIRFSDERAKVLQALTPHMSQLQLDILGGLWREALLVMTTRTRQDFLSDLRTLAPVIAKLGGEAAIAETFHAIQDVGRWWP